MNKTILITGSTDGIGLETAKMLLSDGHKVLLHGRNPQKMERVVQMLKREASDEQIESYVADLTSMSDVRKLADEVTQNHQKIDALINNAGVFNVENNKTADGLDIRFVVNTIAPYLLTKLLLPLLGAEGRVVNLSSAAQSPVDIAALAGKGNLYSGAAYAQSKLAITMWTRYLAENLKNHIPMIVAVNPASMLGSKMVKEAYGVAGGDLRIGADVLVRAALSDQFANASGRYYDNDSGQFSQPHPHGLNDGKIREVVETIEAILKKLV